MNDSQARRQRIDAIFSAALDRPAAERPAFLNATCGEDEALRATVENLLQSSEEQDSFLIVGGALDFWPEWEEASAALNKGDRLGPYRLVSEIGRGGMAVVFLAARDDGLFEQEVALKVLLRGPDRDLLRRRFQQERQILASLQHPNIARLLDGGVTDDGRPFFAMEHVVGEPIDRYCERMRLTVAARLDLFLHVAHAVEAAHRQLVVHRDLKPSNILVTGEGQVKLLDFGIAKLLTPGPESTEAPLTRTTMRVMTPEYASPEQFRGELVTIASDVYQLGVLLYELLTGQRPHKLKDASPMAMAQAICEQLPPRPSAALPDVTSDPETVTAITTARQTSLPRLRRALSGDLDNIVLMALRKEPARRYATVGQLATDIEHHLEGRPVAARSDTLTYRTRKIVQRHALAFGASAAMLAVVVALVVFYTASLAHERDRAQRVANFLAGILEAADPWTTEQGELTARQLLERGAGRIDKQLGPYPETAAEMKLLIGDAYRKLGLFEAAQPLLEESLATRRTLFNDGHPAVAESQHRLGELYLSLSRFSDARTLFSAALETRRRVFGASNPAVGESLIKLGNVIRMFGEHEQARLLHEEALQILEVAYGPEHPEVAVALSTLASDLQQTDRAAFAIPLLERTLRIRERAGPAAQAMVGVSLITLCRAHRRAETPATGLPYCERALPIIESTVGAEHPDTTWALAETSYVLRDLGQLEASRRHLERALATNERIYGPDNPTVLTHLHNLGALLQLMGHHDEAIACFSRSLETEERLLGVDSPHLITTIIALIESFLAIDDRPRADQFLRRAEALHRAAPNAGPAQAAEDLRRQRETLARRTADGTLAEGK